MAETVTYETPDERTGAGAAIIRLRGVEKTYKHGASEEFVLRRINLDVRPGEFMSIMGPSGAGKSTLLHILGMHDAAWRGEYWLHDQPIHAGADHVAPAAPAAGEIVTAIIDLAFAGFMAAQRAQQAHFASSSFDESGPPPRR